MGEIHPPPPSVKIYAMFQRSWYIAHLKHTQRQTHARTHTHPAEAHVLLVGWVRDFHVLVRTGGDGGVVALLSGFVEVRVRVGNPGKVSRRPLVVAAARPPTARHRVRHVVRHEVDVHPGGRSNITCSFGHRSCLINVAVLSASMLIHSPIRLFIQLYIINKFN